MGSETGGLKRGQHSRNSTRVHQRTQPKGDLLHDDETHHRTIKQRQDVVLHIYQDTLRVEQVTYLYTRQAVSTPTDPHD